MLLNKNSISLNIKQILNIWQCKEFEIIPIGIISKLQYHNMNYKRYKQVVNIGCQFFKEHTLNMCTIFLVIIAEVDMYYQAIKSNISYVKASLS